MDDLQALEAALLSGMDGQSDSFEPLCSIDPTTRRITVPDNVFGVESDEQAKRVYFSVPTVVGDNFDLSKARIQINFRNPNGDLGVYLVKDFTADAEGNATFSWSLRRIVTQYKGTVSFVVCATMTTEDNRIDREWNTTLAQGQVLEGLEVTQEMESLAHDIIGQLLSVADEANSAADGAVAQVEQAANSMLDQLNSKAGQAIEEINARETTAVEALTAQESASVKTIEDAKKAVLESLPQDYTSLSKEVAADHFPKIPVGVVQATSGEGNITVAKRIDTTGNTIGINARYGFAQPCAYTFTGAALGEYADVAASHPRIRVWLCARQDVTVTVTFSNSSSGWGSPDGSIQAYVDTTLALKANEMTYVDFDYTNAGVQEFYADPVHWQGVGIMVSLAGRHTANTPNGLYEIDWFITDAFERDYNSDHASHADIADRAALAERAEKSTHADIADLAENALQGTKVSSWRVYRSQLRHHESLFGGLRVKFSPGEITDNICVLTTESIGKVADLRDKKILIKCVRRSYDSNTDIAWSWRLSHTNAYHQEWGMDRGIISHLGGLAAYANNGSYFTIDFDERGYSDTDDVYLRINNSDAYESMAPYSLDIDLLVYIVPADYAVRSGMVIATKLDGFEPTEYLRKDEAGMITEKYITCWGDSLTAMGGWTSTLQSLSGLPVYNGGTGGENVRTIAARQGADVMMLNGITIPADTTPVTLATRAQGLSTEFGYKVAPLLQGGAHVNPAMLGDIEGTLKWTGSSYNDTTGTWTFTRSKAGDAVTLNRPTAMRTNFDCIRNAPHLMVIYMGQNGGYDDLDDLVRMHRLMIEHAHATNVAVLGFSSGSESDRAEYETRMRKEFGRYFISLREYLAHPIYAADGSTIVSCYGLDDAGLTATETDLAAIATGTVPPQLLADSVHYTTTTRTVIGNMLYKRCCELGIF